ncbi:hypothetical protein SAMN02787073_2055 [Chryseobacterium vrystaatense]|uniref:Uncharacterized protein n=1 Tax=Chryseobacterium vrystaatense TaxID=307480 RepID=A0A1M5AXU4_9FLAO|nr:hypothetical protein SAMN02787073_2055 [Chryseobacterium vrystaatense]
MVCYIIDFNTEWEVFISCWIGSFFLIEDLFKQSMILSFTVRNDMRNKNFAWYHLTFYIRFNIKNKDLKDINYNGRSNVQNQ